MKQISRAIILHEFYWRIRYLAVLMGILEVAFVIVS